MEEALRRLGQPLRLKPDAQTLGGGHCLFDAVARQLRLHRVLVSYSDVRRACARYLREWGEWDLGNGAVLKDVYGSDALLLSTYCACLPDSCGHSYNLHITVVHTSGRQYHYLPLTERANTRPIWIGYDPTGPGHYMSMPPLYAPSDGDDVNDEDRADSDEVVLFDISDDDGGESEPVSKQDNPSKPKPKLYSKQVSQSRRRPHRHTIQTAVHHQSASTGVQDTTRIHTAFRRLAPLHTDSYIRPCPLSFASSQCVLCKRLRHFYSPYEQEDSGWTCAELDEPVSTCTAVTKGDLNVDIVGEILDFHQVGRLCLLL
jgi:hypothetical protein